MANKQDCRPCGPVIRTKRADRLSARGAVLRGSEVSRKKPPPAAGRAA
jgi:hypothetical protein